ncbi:mycothiol synthase [Leucobacter sp. BZR 635]
MHAETIVTVAGSLDLASPIIERAEHADGSSPLSDQALLAARQGQRELLLFARAGSDASDSPSTPVAVGVIGQGELDLVVDPPARGQGIGTAALRELLAHPQAAVAGPDGVPGLLAWAHGENPAATALLSGAGFTAVRSLFRMALDPALLPAASADPFAVALPEGFTLRTFAADQPGDAAAWVSVNARAFASHPEQGRVTLADFALMREEAWFDPDDLFLLAAPGESVLAGFTWVKTLRDGDRTEVELYVVGVDPDHAGTGLGRALLGVTLARMAQHHPERVTLYVDGENERAVHMYEAAGFTIDSRSTQWRGPAGPQVSE